MRGPQNVTRQDWLPSDYVRHGWAQGPAIGGSILLGRDENGVEIQSFMVPFMARRAVEWTALGAIQAWLLETAQVQDFVDLNNGFIDRLRDLCDVNSGIDIWNNSADRTREEVIGALETVEVDMGLRTLAGSRMT